MWWAWLADGGRTTSCDDVTEMLLPRFDAVSCVRSAQAVCLNAGGRGLAVTRGRDGETKVVMRVIYDSDGRIRHGDAAH